MTATMMQCGHAANARNSAGDPSCAICIGIHPGAEVPVAAPDLSNRVSQCSYCKSTSHSTLTLPFFAHRPTMAYDSHYCGCRGWD